MFLLARSVPLAIVIYLNCLFSPAQADPSEWEAVFQKFVNDPLDVDAAAKFAATLPTIKNPLNPADDRKLIEGDIPVSMRGLIAYAMQKASVLKPVNELEGSNGELIYHLDSGKPARWTQSDRVLKYAIARATFPDQQKYESVISDIAQASGDWEEACQECGIDFQYNYDFDGIRTLEEFQAATSNKQLTFIVVYTDSGGQFIASAFFPNDTWEKRMLLVDRSYFDLSGGYTGRGVLRHELGHVLGYRHEHTRAIPGCFFEDNNWQPLTPYDPKSVMHYFCGGGGTFSLELTSSDRAGHADFYTRDN